MEKRIKDLNKGDLFKFGKSRKSYRLLGRHKGGLYYRSLETNKTYAFGLNTSKIDTKVYRTAQKRKKRQPLTNSSNLSIKKMLGL